MFILITDSDIWYLLSVTNSSALIIYKDKTQVATFNKKQEVLLPSHDLEPSQKATFVSKKLGLSCNRNFNFFICFIWKVSKTGHLPSASMWHKDTIPNILLEWKLFYLRDTVKGTIECLLLALSTNETYADTNIFWHIKRIL